MALIKCKECKTEVSSKAEICPKCGARVASKRMGCGSLIGISILVIIIAAALANIKSNVAPSSNSSPPVAQAIKTIPTPTAEPIALGSQWIYSQADDAMSKGTTYHAVVLSSNTVEFGFPYSGTQNARLNLRTDPRYGNDVIFSIEKGQILCHSYEDCTVLVRFDDEKATNYSAVGAADNSTEHIFIRNYNRFVKNMLKAKRVRISVNIYKEGAPVFEFDVSDFDQNQYKQKK